MTRNLRPVESHFKRNKNCFYKNPSKRQNIFHQLQKKKVWNKNSHLPICDSVTIWMPIVGVFPSNILYLLYRYRGKFLWKSSIQQINVPNRLNSVLQVVDIQFCLRISGHVMFSQRAVSNCCPIHVHMYAKLLTNSLKLRANGRNILGQQLPTLLDVTRWVRLHTLLHFVGCCCVLLHKVWNLSNF